MYLSYLFSQCCCSFVCSQIMLVPPRWHMASNELLWAGEAWHLDGAGRGVLGWCRTHTHTLTRCVRSSGICTPNLNSLALIVSEISAFITDRRTDGQLARSTRLGILIKNIYTLWGRKRFLLPVTYFSTNLVYPFTLRVTGITTCV